MLSQIEICEVQFEVGLESSKYVANVETIQFNSQPNFDWTASWDSLDSISGSFRKFCQFYQFPENQKFWLIFSIFRLKTHCSSLLTAHQKPEGTIRAYMYHRYSSMKYGGMQHKKIGKTIDASVLCSLNEFVMPVHVRTYTYDI